MSKRLALLIFLGCLGVCLIAIFIGFTLYRNNNRPVQVSTPQVAFPNPLATISFPEELIEYPADWPEELKFPKEFMVVDAASGVLIEDAPIGYSAQLRYRGTPPEALSVMVAFLQANAWEIVDNSHLSSGGVTLIIQRGQGSGHVVFDIDPHDSFQTLVTATFYP